MHPLFRSMFPLLLILALPGCKRELPSDNPEAKAAEERAAATRDAPKPAIELGDPLAAYRQRAAEGDVPAMLFLARSYESLGGQQNLQQARTWYSKAAETGDATAQQALAELDARAAQTDEAQLDAALPEIPAATVPTTIPAVTTVPATTAPASTRPVDLTKLRWDEVMASFDSSEFVQHEPPNAPTGERSAFVRVGTAPDKSMTVAARGPDADDMHDVTILLRLRTRQNPGGERRVIQAFSITNQVTRGNVSQKEFVDWISTYLANGQRSEPIYRNGWRILVTGPRADGKTDPTPHLGEPVIITLRK